MSQIELDFSIDKEHWQKDDWLTFEILFTCINSDLGTRSSSQSEKIAYDTNKIPNQHEVEPDKKSQEASEIRNQRPKWVGPLLLLGEEGVPSKPEGVFFKSSFLVSLISLAKII